MRACESITESENKAVSTCLPVVGRERNYSQLKVIAGAAVVCGFVFSGCFKLYLDFAGTTDALKVSLHHHHRVEKRREVVPSSTHLVQLLAVQASSWWHDRQNLWRRMTPLMNGLSLCLLVVLCSLGEWASTSAKRKYEIKQCIL